MPRKKVVIRKNIIVRIVIVSFCNSHYASDALIMNEERIYMRMPADIAAPRRANMSLRTGARGLLLSALVSPLNIHVKSLIANNFFIINSCFFKIFDLYL